MHTLLLNVGWCPSTRFSVYRVIMVYRKMVASFWSCFGHQFVSVSRLLWYIYIAKDGSEPFKLLAISNFFSKPSTVSPYFQLFPPPGIFCRTSVAETGSVFIMRTVADIVFQFSLRNYGLRRFLASLFTAVRSAQNRNFKYFSTSCYCLTVLSDLGSWNGRSWNLFHHGR